MSDTSDWSKAIERSIRGYGLSTEITPGDSGKSPYAVVGQVPGQLARDRCPSESIDEWSGFIRGRSAADQKMMT